MSVSFVNRVLGFFWQLGMKQRAYEAEQIRQDVIRSSRIFQQDMEKFRAVMKEGGWRNLDYGRNRPSPLDRMEFMRYEWDGPKVFRLIDQGPEFNVAGLYCRPLG